MANRLYNTFTFTGQLNIPKKQESFHRPYSNASGFESNTVKFAINESSTNGQFVEMFGGKNANPFPIKASLKRKALGDGEYEKGADIEIPFSERLKVENVRMVNDFRKTIIDLTTDNELKQKGYELRRSIRELEEKMELTDDESKKLLELYKQHDETVPDRHEFLHKYDATLFLIENLPNLPKDTQVKVTGNVSQNIYKEKVQNRFEIGSLEVVTYDDVPNSLKVTADAFFVQDAVDDSTLQENKKAFVNVYLQSYDSKIKEDNFYPTTLTINAEKLDWENPKHLGMLNLLIKTFQVEGEGVYHIPVEIDVLRGSEEVEFDESKLTATQLKFIALGISSIEDFKPKGKVFGAPIEEYRVVKPLLKEMGAFNFTNGAELSTLRVDELAFKKPDELNLEETKLLTPNETKEVAEPELKPVEDEFAALFGK